jgi:hypothetical protein
MIILLKRFSPLADGNPPGHMRGVCAKLFRAKATINSNMLSDERRRRLTGLNASQGSRHRKRFQRARRELTIAKTPYEKHMTVRPNTY